MPSFRVIVIDRASCRTTSWIKHPYIEQEGKEEEGKKISNNKELSTWLLYDVIEYFFDCWVGSFLVDEYDRVTALVRKLYILLSVQIP